MAVLSSYARTFSKTETDAGGGEKTEHDIPFLKGYTVFNAEQVEGLPEHHYMHAQVPLDPVERIARADGFFAATGASISHGGNRAFYSHGEDHIQLPPFETFRDAESYYATLAHESIHWTKHESGLGRDLGRKRRGDEGYAAEELVAELDSAFLCADLGITAGGPRRPCRLYRTLAESPERRQAGDLHRRKPCAAGERFPAWFSAKEDTPRSPEATAA